MKIRFWGTRGSIATPGPQTVRYGGNTSCVEIVTDAGARFIIDCGTGARSLGGQMMASGTKGIEATLLLSHTHWDHIQGFPFFTPAFIKGNKFTVCGPNGANVSLPEVLAGQMEYTYFPVELAQLGAAIDFRDLSEGTFEIAGARITTKFLNHPAISLGYRIEADGATVLYLSDHEPYWEPLWRSDAEPGRVESILHDEDRRHALFMRDADIVIHDAQYTPEEYPTKKGWGHSTYSYVTQMAAAMGVKRLFLTHHDPTHNDDFLARLEEKAQEMAGILPSRLNVSCAREETEFTAAGTAPGGTAGSAAAMAELSLDMGSLMILVIDDDEDMRLITSSALKRSGHRVMVAPGGQEGLAMAQQFTPDLVVLDLNMPAPDGFEVLKLLRARKETRDVAIIVLTGQGDEASVKASFELGATDFLPKPFTLPQLDARVRSCFAHAKGEKR